MHRISWPRTLSRTLMRNLAWIVLLLCALTAQSRHVYKRQVTVEIGVVTTSVTEESTTAEATTTAEESTTAEQSTTAEPSTTAEESTTAEPSTTAEESTTAEPSTTAEESTTAEQSTTAFQESTTAESTTAEETTVEPTTSAEETTTAEGETTVESTTAEGTTEGASTTEETTESTAKPYNDEPVVPKNYVDEPYVPKKGKATGYSGDEQGGSKVSQGGYSGNVKVEPSGYRIRRANEYGDENVTPPPADESYVPEQEETPEPVNQGYGDNEAPYVEPAGYRKKRANEYGDEVATPPPSPYEGGGGDYGSVTEETPAPIDQGYATEAPPVEPAGYRKKRANEYGDELATPPPPPYGDGGDSGSPTEETPAPIDQGYRPASDAPPVEPAGYRKKRANEYGDELATPPPYGDGGDSGSPTEETPAPIDQGYGPASDAPPVEPAGYRKKRANEYGDELATPPPPPYGDGGDSGSPTEETPAPIDQGYGPASDAPPVEPAGYRKKRANEYGDELATPPPYGDGGDSGSPTEETPSPIDQGYGPASDAPPVEPAGYRKKRANEYGDELATPPSYGDGGDSGSPTEETPAPIDQGYGPASDAPPVEPAGYRKKRANEYGDELATPPPPPYGDGGDSGSPTEETPAPIDQGYGPASDAPPVEPAGYRKKRANEYGDELATPPPPPYGDGGDSGSPTEETPAPIDQGYGPASDAPPVEPAGYRKKRANEYGDELATPPPPPYGDGGDSGSPTEETPAPIDQGYGPASDAPPVEPAGY